jgi:hypothetical protein
MIIHIHIYIYTYTYSYLEKIIIFCFLNNYFYMVINIFSVEIVYFKY